MSGDALHPSAQRVADELARLGVPGRVRQFTTPTRTAKEAAAAIGCPLGAIASCLVFVADGTPLVVVTSGAHRVDTALLAEQLGASEVRVATPEEVRAATGQPIGGVAPVNWPSALRVVLDATLRDHEEIWSAAGTPHAVFPTTFDELATLTGGVGLPVSRDTPPAAGPQN